MAVGLCCVPHCVCCNRELFFAKEPQDAKHRVNHNPTGKEPSNRNLTQRMDVIMSAYAVANAADHHADCKASKSRCAVVSHSFSLDSSWVVWSL